MLLRADSSSIRPVAAIDAPTAVVVVADARQEAFNRLAQIAIGQQVQAKVLSALEDGTFLVHINGATARMNLPADTSVGESLRLTLTASTPRPTFLLGAEANAAATTSVSPSARLIDHLLQAAAHDGAPPALQAGTPLLKTPPTQPGQIASALRDALEFSGLFYESHLGQWAAGSRSLPELQREPQAQAGRLLLAPAESSPAAKLASAGGEPGALGKPPVGQELALQSATLNHPAVQLLPQQLDTLENQRLLWRGELWPGQPLEWEISRDTLPDPHDRHEPHDTAPAAEAGWHSVVRFELPLLGPVTASIRLAGQHLRMQLRTDSDAAALALRTHGGQLADALGAAGATLDSLTVKRDAAGQ